MATEEEKEILDAQLSVEQLAWMKHVVHRQKKFISTDSNETRWETNEEWIARDRGIEFVPGLDMSSYYQDWGKTGRKMDNV